MSDQAIADNPIEEAPEADMLADIAPKHAGREWTVKDIDEAGFGLERTYTQRPLSYFGKIEVFGVLGGTIDRAMKEGMSVDSILEIGDAFSGNANNLDGFIGSMARLAMYAPELIMDIYCVALAIPRGERDWVKSVWERPVEDGGLSDDDGLEVLEVFIAQNAEALRSFFGQKMVGAAKQMAAMISGPVAESPSSKRSKPTPRRTRNQ